jgi:3-hydroxyisobutyrate dehydrogenase-like beta-hydroxyacid dehydrogenase
MNVGFIGMGNKGVAIDRGLVTKDRSVPAKVTHPRARLAGR